MGLCEQIEAMQSLTLEESAVVRMKYFDDNGAAAGVTLHLLYFARGLAESRSWKLDVAGQRGYLETLVHVAVLDYRMPHITRGRQRLLSGFSRINWRHKVREKYEAIRAELSRLELSAIQKIEGCMNEAA